MISRMAIAAAMIASLTLSAAAQVHYQGGPRDQHIGPREGDAKLAPPVPASDINRSDSKGPHYQGGPKDAPHFGKLPAGQADGAKK